VPTPRRASPDGVSGATATCVAAPSLYPTSKEVAAAAMASSTRHTVVGQLPTTGVGGSGRHCHSQPLGCGVPARPSQQLSNPRPQRHSCGHKRA